MRIIGSLDTSVIMRFLTADDQDKSMVFAKLVASAEKEKASLFVPEIVIVELAYTLSGKHYKCAHAQTAQMLESLASMPCISIENKNTVLSAIRLYASGKLRFGDALILAKVREKKSAPLYSFDKDFAPYPEAKVLA
jgi:predicted nucleic-acid-binding protein